jgi:cytochrome b561
MENSSHSPTTVSRYSRGAMVLHWAIAILIALNFAAAWVAEDLPKAEKMQIMGNHKAIGITILILSIIRLLWRFAKPAPPLSVGLKPWEVMLAKITHGLLYLLMIGVPTGGWIMHSAFSGGKAISFFGLFDYPGLPMVQDKALAGLFHELHENGGIAMLVLMGLHVAGALKHQLIDRDDSIWRMLPGRG